MGSYLDIDEINSLAVIIINKNKYIFIISIVINLFIVLGYIFKIVFLH
jgi:hypothetical protein